MLIRMYGHLKNLKFRTRLFVNFLAVALLPLVIMGIWNYTSTRDSLREQVNNRVSDYADRVGGQLDAAFDRCNEAMDEIVYGDKLILLISSLENGQTQSGDLRVYSEQQPASFKMVSPAVHRVDFLLEGDVGVSYNRKELEKAVNLEQAEPENKKQYDKEGRFWFCTEEELFAVCSVPNLYTGREVARMVVSFDKQSFFRRAFMDDSGQFGIIVADNQDRNAVNVSSSVMPTGVIAISYFNKAQSNLIVYNGKQYLFTPYPLQTGGWKLFAITSYEVVAKRTADVVTAIVSAVLAGVFLIGLISLLLSAGVARRIEFLIRQMKRVATGDLLIETSWLKERDEIGQLTHVFENMVSQLDVLIYEAYTSKLAQQESEFKALQTQINPHFLYNCLDNMNWYAIMRGDEHSSYVITQLSDYYRTCLNRGKNNISVQDEIKNAIAYMNLQLELHDNNFTFESEIADHLEQYITINLMLQPLLENAVKHGVDKIRDKTARKLIRLTVTDEGEFLHFTVFNLGSPISQEVLRSVFEEKTKGYGIRNVNERIKLTFGQQYGIQIEPSEVGPDGLSGTVCRVIIPKQVTAEELPQ